MYVAVRRNVLLWPRTETVEGYLVVAGTLLSLGALVGTVVLGLYSPEFTVDTLGRGVVVGES